MKILALDCGKNKSVFLDYQTGNGPREYGKVNTRPQEIHDFLVARRPEVFVLESGPDAGWICDIAGALGVKTMVANTNDERWHWKKNKKKNDRLDALKLAQMVEMGCLPTVHVPEARVRQWRSLIEYRHGLVDRRTAIKNSIRATFERQGQRLPGGHRAWTAADERVKQLKTAPCVGPRLGELVVAVLDDPKRFKTAKQVGAYAGLTPRQWQSGQTCIEGHISRAGNPVLREVLVEVCWLGVRTNAWMKQVYEDVRRGSDKRKKIAIVAVARRLLVRLWAMLRDGTSWKDPAVRTAALATNGG